MMTDEENRIIAQSIILMGKDELELAYLKIEYDALTAKIKATQLAKDRLQQILDNLRLLSPQRREV